MTFWWRIRRYPPVTGRRVLWKLWLDGIRDAGQVLSWLISCLLCFLSHCVMNRHSKPGTQVFSLSPILKIRKPGGWEVKAHSQGCMEKWRCRNLTSCLWYHSWNPFKIRVYFNWRILQVTKWSDVKSSLDKCTSVPPLQTKHRRFPAGRLSVCPSWSVPTPAHPAMATSRLLSPSVRVAASWPPVNEIMSLSSVRLASLTQRDTLETLLCLWLIPSCCHRAASTVWTCQKPPAIYLLGARTLFPELSCSENSPFSAFVPSSPSSLLLLRALDKKRWRLQGRRRLSPLRSCRLPSGVCGPFSYWHAHQHWALSGFVY